MGVTEEAGGVAKRAVTILSGAPMLLVVVLINFGTFSMVTYLVATAIQYRATERAQILAVLERCYSVTVPHK